jgi:hypothetical protein
MGAGGGGRGVGRTGGGMGGVEGDLEGVGGGFGRDWRREGLPDGVGGAGRRLVDVGPAAVQAPNTETQTPTYRHTDTHADRTVTRHTARTRAARCCGQILAAPPTPPTPPNESARPTRRYGSHRSPSAPSAPYTPSAPSSLAPARYRRGPLRAHRPGTGGASRSEPVSVATSLQPARPAGAAAAQAMGAAGRSPISGPGRRRAFIYSGGAGRRKRAGTREPERGPYLRATGRLSRPPPPSPSPSRPPAPPPSLSIYVYTYMPSLSLPSLPTSLPPSLPAPHSAPGDGGEEGG